MSADEKQRNEQIPQAGEYASEGLGFAGPRRYARLDADALEQRAAEEWKKLGGLARRTVKQSIALGEVLLALRAKSVHGTWLPRLERLGIASSSADRLIAIAQHNCTPHGM